MSDLFDSLDDLNFRQTIKDLSPLKQRIAISLVNGDNFNQIGIREGIKTSRIYKIRDEMAKDLEFLKKEWAWKEEETFEDQLFNEMRDKVGAMRLSRFADLYLRGYSSTCYSPIKKWERKIEVYGEDRIIVTISLIIRELFIRTHPIVIDYYYEKRKSLVDLIQRFKTITRTSPIIADRLEVLHTDADLGIRLKDGSQVRAIWTHGKQPKESGTIVLVDENISGESLNIPKITYL